MFLTADIQSKKEEIKKLYHTRTQGRKLTIGWGDIIFEETNGH